MTSVSKNVYIGQLDDIVNKYKNTYHSTVKMKPINVKPDICIDSRKEINGKDSKYEIGDDVRISKYKGYVLNQSENGLKIKNTVHQTYFINDLNGEEVAGSFSEKKLKKTNQKELRNEKVIKKKGDKLYVKWKRYDNQFSSLIG